MINFETLNKLMEMNSTWEIRTTFQNQRTIILNLFEEGDALYDIVIYDSGICDLEDGYNNLIIRLESFEKLVNYLIMSNTGLKMELEKAVEESNYNLVIGLATLLKDNY